MKVYKNEIGIVEREDVTYMIWPRADRFYAEVSYRPENRRWETFTVGNASGYKTKSGAMNAIKRDVERMSKWAPNGLTLVF